MSQELSALAFRKLSAAAPSRQGRGGRDGFKNFAANVAALVADASIPGLRVAREVDRAVARRGRPAFEAGNPPDPASTGPMKAQAAVDIVGQSFDSMSQLPIF
jgi:hypothetical protein